jgi:cell fate (sporulation/competence/biofilm development) regulator YmcA (YheA/YmcA/DUF963 family)
MSDRGKKGTEQKKRKRELIDIINTFYDHLATKDQVHISEFRELDNPIKSPTDQRILQLIDNIQKRPFIYVKKMGRQIILKLSKHNRDPKKRYIQLKPVIDRFEQKSLELRQNAKTWDKSQYGLLLDQYNDMIEETLGYLNDVFEEKEIKNFEE